MQPTEARSARDALSGDASAAHPGGPALPILQHPPIARLPAARASEGPVGLQDPALRVLTDFSLERPVTVTEDYPVDYALREMKRANVRSMLVIRDDVVTGLITSYDIQGERPLQVLLEFGFLRRTEIEVRHIMAPWDSVPVLALSTVRAAQVHQVVEFFRHTRATYLIIIEYAGHGGAFVRGLISRTRLERQLGTAIA
ncbi:MAG TPA: CBS domain-containing protein [Steroidobacteraceae bacterium]|nr:CBS domain-containing protein [Steroidobacteraceae bacterium]